MNYQEVFYKTAALQFLLKPLPNSYDEAQF